MRDDFSITVHELEAERIQQERKAEPAIRREGDALSVALDAMHVTEADEQRATAALSVTLDAIWKMFNPEQKAREIKRWLICERRR
jgi:hypothetical protein